MAVVVALTVAFESTGPGEHVEEAGYNFLQSLLSPDKIPVAVVDISRLNPEQVTVDGQTRLVTSRDKLEDIINAVADKGAKVIGVDVNFAPLKDGDPLTSKDPAFFQFCLDKGKETPDKNPTRVVLAVDWADNPDSEERRPELLIENPSYKDLFACIRIPHDSSKMPYQITDKGFKVLTMSAALAQAYGEAKADWHRWIPKILAWIPKMLARKFSPKDLKHGERVDQFPVDYSALDALQSRDHTFSIGNPDAISVVIRDQGGFLSGKVVLIGDGRLGKAVDIFPVPGRKGVFPGVYLHSCAAYTLIKAPLYEMTGLGSVFIDLLLSFVILASIAGIRWHYKDRTPKEVAKHRLEKLFTFLVALAALAFGVWLLNYHRVLWVDFIPVVAALFLHPSIERYLSHVWHYLRKTTPAAIEKVVFERDEETH